MLFSAELPAVCPMLTSSILEWLSLKRFVSAIGSTKLVLMNLRLSSFFQRRLVEKDFDVRKTAGDSSLHAVQKEYAKPDFIPTVDNLPSSSKKGKRYTYNEGTKA